MDDQAKKRRLQWLRNMPPMFSLMIVVAFGILFYKFIQKFDLTAINFSSLLSVMSPFIIGLVLTFFLVPPVKFVERQLLRLKFFKSHYQLTNLLSILISYFVIFGIVAVVLVYVMPQVFSGLTTLLTISVQQFGSIALRLG